MTEVAANGNQRVFAVVVSYSPELEALSDLLQSLKYQVTGIFLVDNTPTEDRSVEEIVAQIGYSGLRLIRLGENLGVARALNVGIQAALEEEATHLFLSDQDSLPSSDMVRDLLRASRELADRGYRVGAVGPVFTDLHTGITFPFQAEKKGKLFYSHIHATATNPHVNALTLITSGTLICRSVVLDVGLMREDFFVDRVDTEWCHRARAKGYCLFGTSYAAMYQRMGERALRVWYIRWRAETAYSPLRIYYQVRNSVYIWHLDYVDKRWNIRNTWYAIGVVYAQVFFGKQKLKSFRLALRGIKDGICKNMGAYRP